MRASNCTHSAHAARVTTCKLLIIGAPGEVRTPDLLLRRQSLYPSELRAHTDAFSLHRVDLLRQLQAHGIRANPMR